MYSRLGNRPWDRRATIALAHEPDPTSPRRHYRRFGIYPMEHVDIQMPARQILDQLGRLRPAILVTTPSTIAWLAGELTPSDKAKIRPRVVATWGETVTQEMRQQTEEGFGVAITDCYLSHEMRIMAVQCPSTGLYHVHDRTVLLEVLKNGRPAVPGEQGEVVGTALFSYAMPFLRYRQGDLATVGPSPCPCGKAARTLAHIDGRELDRVALPNGGSLHIYSLLTPVVQHTVWVRRYQFRQEAAGRLRLLIVPSVSPAPEQVRAVEAAVRAQLEAGGIDLEVDLVEEIPPSPTGKYYPYISLGRWRAWRSKAS
jgi:phenylacetate-CoA ligase